MSPRRAPLATLGAYWFTPMPAARLATLRALTGLYCVGYLVARARPLCDFTRLPAERFDPVGFAFFLGAPLPAALVWAIWGIAVIAGLGFTAGYAFRISGPAFALLFGWVTSYRNSWGMLFHNENLCLLHAIVLGLSPAADALAFGRGTEAQRACARYGWPVRLLCAVTVATYFIAGVAKLRLTGLEWLDGDALRGQIARDAVHKQLLGSVQSPLGLWLARAHWPFAVLSPLTLLLEVGAPLALFWRRVALPWVVLVFGFHVAVAALMAIAFPYPISGVAFASFFAAERIWTLGPLRKLALRLGQRVPIAGTDPTG